MAKKPKAAEPKKECPSCGLGVSLESAICEFCGWDFQEENEWILQIEKLERELMLEKQKFEPGTVGAMIESTLRNPHTDKPEAPPESAEESRAAKQEIGMPEFAPEEPSPAPEAPKEEYEAATYQEADIQEAPKETPKVRRVRSVRPAPQVAQAAPSPQPPAQQPRVRKVAAQQQPERPAPVVRKVRQPPQAEPSDQPAKVRKVRSIRKV